MRALGPTNRDSGEPGKSIRLSIVIICWNDAAVILDCLQSIYAKTGPLDFEVIVADNASTDASLEHVRRSFPQVQIVENGANMGFGRGNNTAIRRAQGEYVLILNPDTIVHHRALEKLLAYADRHPEAGAFACRTLNRDGSLQQTAQPRPTVGRYLVAGLCLRWLGRLSERWLADSYVGWDGHTDRTIGFQAGCCLLVRGTLLKALGGFDERFFHQYEDADLCHRIWDAGFSVLFCPDAEITHIGGQNRGNYPVGVVLETERSKYGYFHKHYGTKGALRIRYVSLIALWLRYCGYSLLALFRQRRALENRLQTYRILLKWHWQLNPIRFIESGEEADVGYKPLSAAATAQGG